MQTQKRRISESVEPVNPVTAAHVWSSPAGSAARITLVTHLDVYADMHQHACDALPNETGGFLLGRVALDRTLGAWHVEVDEMLPVEPVQQDPVHFSFSWRDVDRARTRREEAGKAVIGWYHTHPNLGIFLSETDLEKTHRVLFGEPFQAALVYDPVRRRAGYFFWESPRVIDASEAVWREFEISIAAAEPASAEPAAAEPASADPASADPASADAPGDAAASGEGAS